jgi:hypothetical protein
MNTIHARQLLQQRRQSRKAKCLRAGGASTDGESAEAEEAAPRRGTGGEASPCHYAAAATRAPPQAARSVVAHLFPHLCATATFSLSYGFTLKGIERSSVPTARRDARAGGAGQGPRARRRLAGRPCSSRGPLCTSPAEAARVPGVEEMGAAEEMFLRLLLPVVVRCKGKGKHYSREAKVGVGTKYREPRTEPNLPRTEPKFTEPKYSVPCSVPSLQEPKYRGKYRNRTELTESTEVT